MSTNRGYRSSLREEQAQRTRLLIRRAARDLFGSRGFAATTIAHIAADAGVSAATVYAAYESKAGIVSAMLEELEESSDMGTLIPAIFAATDAHEQLRLWVNAHSALFAGGVAVLKGASQARSTPEVSVLYERGDARRRSVIEALVAGWEQQGLLRIPAAEAADQMWMLTTVESYLAAIDQLGWASERYRDWLIEIMEHQVFVATG